MWTNPATKNQISLPSFRIPLRNRFQFTSRPNELSSLQLFRRRSVKNPLLWEATVALSMLGVAETAQHQQKPPGAPGGGCWFNIRARPNSRRWKARVFGRLSTLYLLRDWPFSDGPTCLSQARPSRRVLFFFSTSEPNPKTLTPLRRGPFFKAKRLFFPAFVRGRACALRACTCLDYVSRLSNRAGCRETVSLSLSLLSPINSSIFLYSSISKVKNLIVKRTLSQILVSGKLIKIFLFYLLSYFLSSWLRYPDKYNSRRNTHTII